MRAAAFTAAGCLIISQHLSGAGFALHEHSFSGLGVGFASGAAGGSDNSSMFFNPATLTLFGEPEITSGIHFIMPEAEFKNTGTLSAYAPGTSPGVPTQGPNDTSDKAAVVPNFFYSRPMGDQWTIGLGISTPYGLATEYEDGWVGRYIAIDTDLTTVNANLAFGYRISDSLSFGFGMNLMYGDAILSNAVNYGLIYLRSLQNGTIPANAQTQALAQDVQANLGGTKYDGKLELEGDDIGYGFNLGFLFTPDESTRIGLSYRSKVKLTLEGEADFTVGALDAFFGPLFVDQGGSVEIELPDTMQVSVHRQVNERFAVMADVFYTWWSKFDELVIEYETGFPSNSIIPEKWDDTWRYSVGATYQLNDRVELRGGLVVDESGVTENQYRSPRIPDEDRFWMSLGLGYRVNESLRFDVAYVHIFVDDPVIDNPTHTAGEWLKGTMDATVDIFSIGGTWQF
jgi:long-chain fatty acid transport protein